MSTATALPDLVSTLKSIRRCFWLLKNVSDAMLTDLGITASQRAILEHLVDAGPATVPVIAAAKSVKRQSIQELIDSLLAKALITATANPAHRRSPQYQLSRAGVTLFKTIEAREIRVLKRLAGGLDARALTVTATTLTHLHTHLHGLQTTGDIDD